MATLISRSEGSPPPRHRETPLDTISGVDSHHNIHSHETKGARHAAPSHMGQGPLFSVSSMSMGTTSLNTPVFGGSSASNHGDQSPNCRSPPPWWGRSISGGSTITANPCPSQSPQRISGSQHQTLGSTACSTQVRDNLSGTAKSSIEPTWFNRLTGVIPDNIITEIRNLVSHQGLQRRKLTTAASNLNTLRSLAHKLRTNTKSLMRRIDHVHTQHHIWRRWNNLLHK